MAKEEAKKAAAKAAPPPRPRRPKAKKAEGRGGGADVLPVRRETLPADYVPRLRKHYDEVVRPQLIEEFGYKNAMQVPKHHQDRSEHGHRRGDAGLQAGAGRGRASSRRSPARRP